MRAVKTIRCQVWGESATKRAILEYPLSIRKDLIRVEKKGKFYIHIIISNDIVLKTSFSSILAVDFGERVIATAVLFVNNGKGRPMFYGRKVRGVRRHFAWLRKRLGEKKLLKMSKGRRLNRIVSNMPYYQLTKFIEYKAKRLGIPVIKISERGTSKTCPKYNQEGRRPHQGLFVCKCGYSANADFIGAQNIGKRAMDYMSIAGVHVNVPLTEPFLMSSEASVL